MKSKAPAYRSSKKKFPTPEWMCPAIARKAKMLDPIARIEMAEQLEKTAAELREFKPPRIKHEVIANIPLKPAARKAVLYYAEMGGAKSELSEQERINIGARWFLEESLCLFQTIHDFSIRRIRYRDAEELEDSVQTEHMIRAAFEQFKERFDTESDECE